MVYITYLALFIKFIVNNNYFIILIEILDFLRFIDIIAGICCFVILSTIIVIIVFVIDITIIITSSFEAFLALIIIFIVVQIIA